MAWSAAVLGFLLIVAVLRDAFETMILPRRLAGRFRFTRNYFRLTWQSWAGIACHLRPGRRRETLLSLYGPLSMLWLFALWAVGLISGYALLYHGLGSPLHSAELLHGIGMDFYVSGTTFFTLGLGDVVPATTAARVLLVIEAGMGFGFIAVIIGYLPVLYQGFSRREISISMLDARAGSPPTASELLRRHAGALPELQRYLAEWERWSAELLESHISYPVLGFFRSQHVNQSWLAALTTLLDACAVLMACAPAESCARQAQLTFAMARHAVVDLAQIFLHELPLHADDRLPPLQLERLVAHLRSAGLDLHLDADRALRLNSLRAMYERHVCGIAHVLCLHLPVWVADPHLLDNWQRSPWDSVTSAQIGRLGKSATDRHF